MGWRQINYSILVYSNEGATTTIELYDNAEYRTV